MIARSPGARALVLVAALITNASAAHADEPTQAPPADAPAPPGDAPSGIAVSHAEGERLFEAGKLLLDKGDWIAACTLFEASAKLDELPPVLVKVARCKAHDNRLAAAIATYKRALDLRPWADLEALIRRELAEVEARAPAVRIAVAGAPKGLTLARNGVRLPPESWNDLQWTDVDRVEHFVAEAPGYRTVSRDLTATAERQRLEWKVSLEREVAPAAAAGTPTSSPPAPTPPGVIAGWASLGAGALGLGFALGFGIQFAVQRDELFDDCTGTLEDGRYVCPAGIEQAREETIATRTRAQVLAVVGGALTATGITLVLVPWSDSNDMSTSLVVGPGAMTLRGSW